MVDRCGRNVHPQNLHRHDLAASPAIRHWRTCLYLQPGEVDALKVETEGDVTKLYAQLIPNEFLLDANRMGQKLFTSAEFVSDFGGSGREYLFGLAVTDIPASLGTEKIKFVLAGEEKDAERGNLETFSLGDLHKDKPGFWTRLFTAGKNFTPTPEPNTDKPSEGDGEKWKS